MLHFLLSLFLATGVLIAALTPLSRLPNHHKPKLFLALASICYCALLVSTLRRVKLKQKHIYTPPTKHNMPIIQSVFQRNIGTPLPSTQTLIAFYSSKDQGATHYLGTLADSLHPKPTLYIKPKFTIKTQQQFMDIIGLSSFLDIVKIYCSKDAYLFIDDFDLLLQTRSNNSQLLFFRILSELVDGCGTNVIMNTQDNEQLNRLVKLWQSKEPLSWKKFPFQLRKWRGPQSSDLHSIYPNIHIEQSLINIPVNSFKDLEALRKFAVERKQ